METAQLDSKPSYSLWQLVLYMLKLGTWGFGGPVALAGYMNRDLVEKYGWITEADYKEGMALAQMHLGAMFSQPCFLDVQQSLNFEVGMLQRLQRLKVGKHKWLMEREVKMQRERHR